MAKTRIITTDEIEQANKLYEEGLGYRQIATIMNYSVVTIGRYIKNPKGSGRRPALNIQQIQEVNKLYDAGWTMKQLGEKFFLTDSCICKYIWHPRPKSKRAE